MLQLNYIRSDAIERGFINQDTIMTSRINGQLHDYILEGEPIKPHEIITIEKVSDVLKELETCEFPNITFTEVSSSFGIQELHFRGGRFQQFYVESLPFPDDKHVFCF
ncbi:competence regulator inhibitor paratox [Streptococcus parasuis]|uniref:competence regulator inhibitor paratox n=1 Tax=Streptococcus parasuis TaxID=1501662 RepID=UPI003F6D7576